MTSSQPPQAGTDRAKRLMSGALKVLISLAALLMLYLTAAENLTLPSLSTIQWWPMVGAVLLIYATQVLFAARYRVLLQQAGVNYGWPQVIRIHFIAFWFNLTLPTGYVGDAMKIALRARADGLKALATSVFMERYLGLLAICLTGLLLASAHLALLGEIGRVTLITYAVFCVGSGAAFLTLRLLMKHAATLPARLGTLLHTLYPTIKTKETTAALALSLAIHVASTSVYILLGHALGLQLTLLDYFVIIPLVFIAALMPISYAGWGVRELSAFQLFAVAGFSGNDGIILAATYGLLNTLCASPGALLFLASKHTSNHNSKEPQSHGKT